MSQAAHAEANIIFGAVIDDALGDEVRVTVIAAGFDGGMPKRREGVNALRRDPVPAQSQAETRVAAQAAANRAPQSTPAPAAGDGARPQPSRQVQPASATTATQQAAPAQPAQPAQPRPAQPRPAALDDDELDVPDFLK